MKKYIKIILASLIASHIIPGLAMLCSITNPYISLSHAYVLGTEINILIIVITGILGLMVWLFVSAIDDLN